MFMFWSICLTFLFHSNLTLVRSAQYGWGPGEGTQFKRIREDRYSLPLVHNFMIFAGFEQGFDH